MKICGKSVSFGRMSGKKYDAFDNDFAVFVLQHAVKFFVAFLFRERCQCVAIECFSGISHFNAMG